MALSNIALSRTLKGMALFAGATGTMDLLLGAGTLGLPSNTSMTGPMALMDSQMRFLAAVWAGYGAALWWASNDIKGRRDMLGILGGVMFAGGLGRVISYIQHGFGVSWIPVAMAIELAGPPAMYFLGC